LFIPALKGRNTYFTITGLEDKTTVFLLILTEKDFGLLSGLNGTDIKLNNDTIPTGLNMNSHR